MKKFLIFSMALFFAVSGLNAQYFALSEDASASGIPSDVIATLSDTTRTAIRTTWIANPPASNWFLSLQGGLAALYSDGYQNAKLKDRTSPTFGLALGRWFNPVWGLRLSGTYSKLHSYGTEGGTWYIGQYHPNINGVESPQDYFTGDNATKKAFIKNRFLNDAKVYDNGYIFDFSYVGASLDFLLNLKNVFTHYNPNAFFNPVVYGGLGYAHTFKDGDRTAVNSIMEKVGLQLNFRLAKNIDLYLAGESLFVPEIFDRQVGGDYTQDIVVNALVGLTFHFGGSNYPVYTGGVAPKAAPVEDRSHEIDALNRQINALKADLAKCKAAPPVPKEPAPQAVKEIELEPVFFTLDSYAIQDSQLSKIEKAAKYLKENPGKKLELSGYADVQTGTPAYNQRLSEKRVNAVADYIVKNYGIDRNRLTLIAKGDKVQPFTVNENNRVVIFVK
ncbi:MAG: OmpA family protein [Dysgonamonadaceae bacterium]|jgi:outer membrane protein OmpA-like peptidoglycan-associated protein|nr:OmpA family protein [Dysgonamonadaceae bacterium]